MKGSSKDPNWRDVLRVIYDYAPDSFEIVGNNTVGIPDDFLLAKNLGMTGPKLEKHLAFLTQNGLVNDSNVPTPGRPSRRTLKLTERGFNVALDNESKMANARIQVAILLFTAMLGVTTGIDFLVRLSPVTVEKIVYILLYSIFILYLYRVAKKAKKVLR